VTTDEVVLSSLLTGQQVATALDRLQHDYPQAQHPDEYVLLELLTNKDNRLAFDTIHVRFFLDAAKTVLPDEAEILHCTTDDGRTVSIELGTPAYRANNPARIRVST